MKIKENFGFIAVAHCQDTATARYPHPTSPAKIRCALQLRGPGQARVLAASLCLTSLWVRI
jgi:hypothetical protein